MSRSGTLTYQIMHELAQAGIGISTCVGIGGDPVIGTQFLDAVSYTHLTLPTNREV